MDAPCRIELLGDLRVVLPDRIITRFQTQKTGALLAYLACYRKRSHPREELVERLWPEAERQAGRNRLKQALAALRRQLEPAGVSAGSFLIADRQSVRLHPDAVTTDVAAFEAALAAAAKAVDRDERTRLLRDAVEQYRGELLPGYYEDWVFAERERLTEAYLLALRQLCPLLEQRGELAQAIDCAHRAVAVDPLREEAHRELMRLLLAADQPSRALRQYREMERLLRDELDEAPSPAARALAEGAKQQMQDSGSGGGKPAPTPPSAPPAASRLPVFFTRFFGREEEMAQLTGMLRDDAIRLVTLTGPGGSGKTRLAVEVARRAEAAFPDAVWFAPLADLRDPNLLADALADVLGVERGAEPLPQVAEALSHRPSLLILDNFEQLVLAGAGIVRDLLERAPSLKCVVTSRQRLLLDAEREFCVHPLPTPPSSEKSPVSSSPELLLPFASVRLFVDRAQSVRPDFQITRENAPAVAELCERLEGIPLAIELAAARAQVLTPAQMLAQMERRFDFLASRRRDAQERHRTLRSAIAWSYQMVLPELQRFFARLSVFRGGWTLEAAEFVCEEPRALDYLTQLQDYSLLLSEEAGEQMRFRMLETLREYAEEQLSPEEQARLRQRHFEYYLALANEARPHTNYTTGEAAWLKRLESESGNLRAALGWCLSPEGEAERGLPLALALDGYWFARGCFAEQRHWLETLLEAAPSASEDLRAAAFYQAGRAAQMQCDYPAARRLLDQALALYQRRQDRHGVAVTLNKLGLVAQGESRYEAARALFEESLALCRQGGSPSAVAHGLKCLGGLALELGDFASARALYEEGLALYRRIPEPVNVCMMIGELGHLALLEGDREHAETLLTRFRDQAREAGIPIHVGRALADLGVLARHRGDLARAQALLEEALATHRQVGHRGREAENLCELGFVALAREDPARAHGFFTQSLTQRWAMEDWQGSCRPLEGLARLALQSQPANLRRAARLLGAADAFRESLPAPLPPIEQPDHERFTAALRAALGGETFAEEWAKGRALTWEQAVVYALSAAETPSGG